MRLMGFNFEKIGVERMKDTVDKLSVDTNIDVLDVREIKTDILSDKETLLQAKFSYVVKYDPGFAKIEINGSVLFAVDEKEAKEILKEWKKKELPEDFRVTFFNIVLKKAALRSLHLEEEMNLPLHIPLPTIRPDEDKKKGK